MYDFAIDRTYTIDVFLNFTSAYVNFIHQFTYYYMVISVRYNLKSAH